ncbi:DUF6879 family protein [Thermobifida cellulosilytica]|uniref:DUF6879 domain-containing protein n=1 Tax=Thermobifida cellulosilytica TB100 TaxID=665004 RepID=A0A147KE39_THECS|nr:DUF6879 family protein [Thermobifida cellulosilytica]KUP95553.1 hypothetical protein AC529_16865 [Thermobifida cellulosilytica TB100]
MRLGREEWREFFDSYTDYAFRLETLPVYKVAIEDDEYRRFLAGEKRPESELHTDEWLRRVSGYVASGRRLQRVHVITPPLTEYLRYEFEWGYDFNVRVGEEIGIIDTTEAPELSFPAHEDFWLFDDKHVVLMRYEEDGTQIDRLLLEDVDVDEYIARKDAALAMATPYQEYRARLDG